MVLLTTSVAEPHYFYAAPPPIKNFDAAPDPAAPDPAAPDPAAPDLAALDPAAPDPAAPDPAPTLL
jgi:hypothetical protein